MNRQKWMILIAGLALIGATAAILRPLKSNQKLGRPGVKTTPIADSRRLRVFLPETVPGYSSLEVPTEQAILDGLPHDTSFAQRYYVGPELTNFTRIVLMGTDRTSIHKPQFCLEGGGWNISDAASSKDVIHLTRPAPYDLPVMKLVTTKKALTKDGKPWLRRGIYVYWFVADGDLTNDHWARMRSSTLHLLKTGELERWAYVSCFAVCQPGEEDGTYDRMKKFIALSVPEFQLSGSANRAPASAVQTVSR